MSNKKNTKKSRRKRKNIMAGKELVSLKSKKISSNNKQQNIKKQQINKKTEIKTIEKPKSNFKENNNKKRLTIIISLLVVTVLGYFIYGYVYDNYLHKGNYMFKTNIENTTVELSSSANKIDTMTEKIDNTILNISLYYDQIKIKNSKFEENLSNDSPFFKYYGEEDIILVADDKYIIDYIYFTPFENQDIVFESNNDSIMISDNLITVKDNGEATVYAHFGEEKIELLNVISTNLLVQRPKEFDETKEFITCEQYTNEENAFLDKILEKKINDVGYQTRAGAVEALRFMALDLPFRIDYFNENGRLPYIDAQGRYYHKGLYLSKGKYEDLLDPDEENKGTWGCTLYSNSLPGYEKNGLDCSGLLGWALYNAGYDPNDIKGSDLLFELGEIHDSKKIIDSGKVKVGDFVHNNEATSHIGMLIGIDDEGYYYVCQSIWYKPNGVCISKYTKKQFTNHWLQIALMDKYYKEDGNLTNMWY